MKKVFSIFTALLLTAMLFAQAPEKMSYQAVIRNSSNALVTNSNIGIQISILKGSANGMPIYVERHFPATNANGLVTIEIGSGTVISGNFTNIDWANGPYFIKTETDLRGGANYTIASTSQLLSVPYALYAKSAESSTKTITETQNLSDVISEGNSANGQIKNLSDPTDPQDAATKAYVDALLARIEVLEESLLLINGFTDSRDGNHYKVIKIGNQIWMAENLKYLPSVVGPGTGSNTTPYYYLYDYNGTEVGAAKSTSNYATYGVLYNWPAAMGGSLSGSSNPNKVQGVCPTGWHLPSDAEWIELIDFLGGVDVAGGKLKETGTTHWLSPNVDATNETGFTALPGGIRHFEGYFLNLGCVGNWWTTTEESETSAWCRIIVMDTGHAGEWYEPKEIGASVRCVKDIILP